MKVSRVITRIPPANQPIMKQNHARCEVHDMPLMEVWISNVRIDCYCPRCKAEEIKEMREG